MPLVVPGIMGNKGGDDKTSNWMNQLMGKKIGDSSDNTVRISLSSSMLLQANTQTNRPSQRRTCPSSTVSSRKAR